MEIIFFDYYHPYAGLCNQLYLLTNHIHNALLNNKMLYVHRFNLDIFKKSRRPLHDVFDIHSTNQLIEKLTGKKVISTNPPTIITSIPELRIYPVSSIELLACLQFNKGITDQVKVIRENYLPDDFYGIHFRLEIDCILHYTFPSKIYDEFMDLVNTDNVKALEYFERLDKTPIEKYCNGLMQDYLSGVQQFGFDHIWFISTGITKWPIHNYFIPYFERLVNFITSNGGKVYINPVIYQERELNALVDLLILRDSIKMIGFSGSSFSEGYCYKVNEIRKVTREFLFVKENQ